jgi:GNAT superfamily N-acetyltransferase
METPAIIGFTEALSTHFKDLNVAWLQKYFYVEPIDIEMLGNPQKNIIELGGHIYFAKVGDEIAGTVALLKIGNDVFELGKMAVDEKHQGKKVGHLLMEHCIKEGKRLGAQKLILYSNTLLKPAIHLYQKFGFIEVPIINSNYQRSNIKMEKILA